MDLILIGALFVGGIYALIKAEVPTVLIGGPKYQVTGTGARVLGVAMLLPMPLIFVTSLALGLFFNLDPDYVTLVALAVEWVILLGTTLIILIAFRVMREPRLVEDSEGNLVEAVPDVEADIARKARGSLIYVALGFFGPVSLILCPLAFIRSRKAIRMIDEQRIGLQYRGTAQLAMMLSGVVLAGWISIFLCMGLSFLAGSALP